MNVFFETFGCRLNRAEALEEEARYLAAGFVRVEKASEADVAVVRGCSVTARAQRDCERRIDHLRARHPGLHVVVTGCLDTRTSDFHPPATVRAVTDALPLSTARAYLKVQDGCSGKCTFCIVPSFRGASRSEPFSEVLAKARRFFEAGYREIVVTGCNLALYASEGRRLGELVRALADISPELRVRLGSVEPGPAADALVEAMAACPNVCRFLHVPIQSGSDRILRVMGRPYGVADVEGLLARAAQAVPGLAFGCDLMSGFPGETTRDHAASCSLLNRHLISNVHVFPYSERPGTPAARLPGAVPHDVRSERAHELADAGAASRKRFATRQVGRVVEIVAESESELVGWTGEYLWCRVRGGRQTNRRRERVRVRVTGADGDTLFGREVV